VKAIFWLIDINAEFKENETELWLWGIDQKGNRILILDKNFTDYFYALIEDNHEPSDVQRKIRIEFGDSAEKLEISERKYFGEPTKTIKIYSHQKTKLSKRVQKVEGVKDCLEDDVRSSTRYLIDNNVVPCSWHEVEVKETENTSGIRVDKVYLATSKPKLLEETDLPQLRILGFYLTCYSREGSPKPDRNPIIMISTITNNGEEVQFTTEKNDEKAILEAFIKYIQNFDPDIITGYGTNTLDYNYLRERCRILGLEFRIDRAETEPRTSVYGHVSLTGTINLDLADFHDQFPDVKVETLENLADHLGVLKLKDRTVIWDVDFADYWDDPKKCTLLIKFAQDNAQCVIGIAKALLDLALQLSSLVSMPLDHVMTAAVGFRVDAFLMKQAQKIGELIPKRVEQPYLTYTGGLVLQPKPGIHENIAVLDFKSMYPNLMIVYNLSPDTYISPEEKLDKEEFFEAPEVKHRFRKRPPGFFKAILMYLIAVRGVIRSKMKNLDHSSMDYQVLDARQKAIKIVTNATYGYAGWVGARWYKKQVAEAASAWGRHTVQTAIEMVEKAGLTVIYGDTDSIFTTFDQKKTPEIEKEIALKLGLEIELGIVYDRIFFTEAKKRYAGLLKDGTLDIVGLEVIRGDWAQVAKEAQENVLKIILKEQSPQKALAYVHTFSEEIRQRKVPYRNFVIWKSLSKPVDKYAINAGHVEAAKMLQLKGWKMTVGDKVGYVIIKGKGRLYERVKPYVYSNIEELDTEYYVSKQVVPAASRILEFFGITEKMLLSKENKIEREKSLVDYFGS
jgi:DNA polymerase, archaea type